MPKKIFKSGFVAIMGRPNVGKSTILNALVGDKISIVSPIPQTTRYQIKGILNLKNAQIVFVDTPGMHTFKDRLASHLNTVARKALEGCDLILYVVDVSRKFGEEEKKVMDLLFMQKIKVIMVMNKMDLGVRSLNEYISLWEEKAKAKAAKEDPLIYYLPLSAKTGKNVDLLRDIIVEKLPQQEPFYDQQTLTDFPLKFRVADIVREKLFLRLKEELPHSLAVEVQDMEERETTKGEPFTYIKVNLYVNRPSQRQIIIGKAGRGLKEAGCTSRQEIEKILNQKVHLDIWVKVASDWQEKPRILKELGYWWA